MAVVDRNSTIQMTTPAGTVYSRVDLAVDGADAWAYTSGVEPAGYLPLVIHFHGGGGNRNQVNESRMIDFLNGAMDRGWVVVAASNGMQSFGSPAVMEQTRTLHEWARRTFNTKATIVHGFSMGGMAAYNVTGREEVWDQIGAIVINGTVDSLASNSLPSIRTTYGATSDADLLIKQAGYDPARDDPNKWAGKPIFMSYSPNDTAVPSTTHGDVFYGRAVTPEEVVYHVGTHSHLAVAGFMHPEALAWSEALLASTPAPQPPIPDPDPDPGEGASSLPLYLTDGTRAALFDVSGRSY